MRFLKRRKNSAKNIIVRRSQAIEEMLKVKEIDIVTIATPSGLHAEPAIAAAKAGKHVICEKPLDVTLERIDSMIAAHKKAGTLLAGVFQNDLPTRWCRCDRR